jgi:hypothetical protein
MLILCHVRSGYVRFGEVTSGFIRLVPVRIVYVRLGQFM